MKNYIVKLKTIASMPYIYCAEVTKQAERSFHQYDTKGDDALDLFAYFSAMRNAIKMDGVLYSELYKSFIFMDNTGTHFWCQAYSMREAIDIFYVVLKDALRIWTKNHNTTIDKLAQEWCENHKDEYK